jgi:hypothetical protein
MLRPYLPCKGIATNRVVGLVIQAVESGSAQTAELPSVCLAFWDPSVEAPQPPSPKARYTPHLRTGSLLIRPR